MFYFVERDAQRGRAARKIGITNVAGAKTRLSVWRRQGFTLVAQRTHESGQLILNLEQSVLNWIRHDLKIPQFLDKVEMPRGGATETLPADEPPTIDLLDKIEREFQRLSRDFLKS
jgi:hypothetical protein